MRAVLTAKFVVICNGSSRKVIQNNKWSLAAKNLMEEKMSECQVVTL